MQSFDRLAPICLCCYVSELHEEAQAWAQRLGLALESEQPLKALYDRNNPQLQFVMTFDEQGLALQQLGKKAPGPVRVDFGGGSVAHRRKFGGGSGQMIAKAVGVKASRPLHVLDATAGLGKDAFVLASLGCNLQLLERTPVVAALLADGLARGQARSDMETQSVCQRMKLTQTDSLSYLRDAVADSRQFDVVYLDPMFPERSKSAQIKKDMLAFHSVVGRDDDAGELLSLARQVARYRVVVKRPRKAPFLDAVLDAVEDLEGNVKAAVEKAKATDKGLVEGTEPSYQLEGKTSRYDIYVNAKLPE